jgi:hypothetical protein
MFPQYYPNLPAPCFGAMPIIPVSDFDEEMRTFNPMAQMRPMTPMNHSMQKPQMAPSDFEKAPGSPTTLDAQYTQGYLKTQIGKKVKIMFLLGTNIIQDRLGILTDVGISFVVITEEGTNNPLLCDIYAIKFVTFYS